MPPGSRCGRDDQCTPVTLPGSGALLRQFVSGNKLCCRLSSQPLSHQEVVEEMQEKIKLSGKFFWKRSYPFPGKKIVIARIRKITSWVILKCFADRRRFSGKN